MEVIIIKRGLISILLVSISLLFGCGNGDKQKVEDLQWQIEIYEKENDEYKKKIEQLEEEIKH